MERVAYRGTELSAAANQGKGHDQFRDESYALRTGRQGWGETQGADP